MNCCGYAITDQRTGDVVCSGCGRLEQNLRDTQNIVCFTRRHEFIETVCANNHIAKVIEEEAIFHFFKGTKNRENNTFAAYCIYLACKTHNAARSLVEVAKMCFVSVFQITQYNTNEIEISPSELAERAFEKLDITSFTEKKEIKQLADALFCSLLRCSPPQSALAVAISAIHKNALTKNCIAYACDTSPSCLRRLCRVYKHEIEEFKSLSFEQSSVSLFYQERKL